MIKGKMSMTRREIDLFKQQLEVFFNCTHDAISLIQVDGEIFQFIQNNEAHKRITGIYDVEGMTPEEVAGDEKGGILRSYFMHCVSSRMPLDFEMEFEFVSGKHVWLTSLTPMSNRDRVRYIIASSKDITEMKAAQKDKEEAAKNFITMFSQHSAIMLLVDPVTGQIVEANPAACSFYGFDRDEFLKLRIFDLNMLSVDEVKRQMAIAMENEQQHFVFPHRTKSETIHFVDEFTCPVFTGSQKLLFSIIFDVSDREEYRKNLFNEKELFRTTLSSIGDGVVTTDLSGRITIINDIALNITGWNKVEVIGRQFSEVFVMRNEITGEPVEDPIKKVLKTGKIIDLSDHTELINRTGSSVPIADSASPIKSENGDMLGVVMVFRDISREKKQGDRILHISYHDFLTGLHNRRYVEEYFQKAEATARLPLSIIIGDINGLKLTNDIFGHDMGDQLLIKAAEIMRKNCPKNSIVARWGGDEFIILLPNSKAAVAESVTKKVRNACEAEKTSAVKVSLSLGFATIENSMTEMQEMIRKAEEYMYHHKLLDGKSYHNALINTLLATLYEKSVETEEHTKRLGNLCYAVGHRLRLHSRELDELSLLALLHDIGKVGIRQSILKKPGKLTDDEWIEMKQHSAIGYRIAKSTPELAGVAEYILYHHERWDGTGYPQGLAGEEIPLNCRILALADAYDAMTSDRVYRNAMTQSEAISELQANAGTQFDPKLVAPFIKIVLSLKSSL
jgi:diguanylate cyclase